jgi:PhnB protein
LFKTGPTSSATMGGVEIIDGRPDGYTTLTPFLVCRPADQAIDFYTQVFGAKLIERMDGPDGTVAHAELDLGLGRLQLGDPSEAFGLVAPSGEDAVSRSTVIYVADVDAVYAAAVEAGARSREEPSTFVTGDRFASILDPFGHRWAIMTRVEAVDPEEARRRLAEWSAENL